MFKFNKNYRDLRQVEKYYSEFKKIYDDLKAKGEFPYNDCFKDKIEGIKGNDEDTAIYLLQRLEEKKEKEELERKMLADGWEKLTELKVKEASKKRTKILLKAKHTNDWATWNIDKILKPHCFIIDGVEKWGLMELRAKTRGYDLSQFEDAFCKLV